MGADQGRLHPDGLLEQAGAFVESLLLKSNGAEDGTGDCLRFGIGKSQLRLPVSFFQPALLDEQDRLLEGVTPFDLTRDGPVDLAQGALSVNRRA